MFASSFQCAAHCFSHFFLLKEDLVQKGTHCGSRCLNHIALHSDLCFHLEAEYLCFDFCFKQCWQILWFPTGFTFRFPFGFLAQTALTSLVSIVNSFENNFQSNFTLIRIVQTPVLQFRF